MPIQIDLPPEAESELRSRASLSGKAVETYLSELVGRHLRNGGDETDNEAQRQARIENRKAKIKEILAPLHEDFQKSGLSTNDLNDLIEQARNEVHAERTCKPPV